MEEKELQKIFKKYSNLYFLLDPESLTFGWRIDKETGMPYDKIYAGILGEAAPRLTLSPMEIKELTYTKPGLFKKGLLSIVGVNGEVIKSFFFKSKDNIKVCEKFNECLALYKEHCAK